jgi:hypothetical protein
MGQDAQSEACLTCFIRTSRWIFNSRRGSDLRTGLSLNIVFLGAGSRDTPKVSGHLSPPTRGMPQAPSVRARLFVYWQRIRGSRTHDFR